MTDPAFRNKSTWFKTRYLVKNVLLKFFYDNGLNHSGSIAFFTVFSLPGVVIGLVWIFGFLIGELEAQEMIRERIQLLIGPQSATQVVEVVGNLTGAKYSITAMVITICTLIYGATSVFSTIQDGINVMWGLRPKPRRFALKFLINRLMSLSMIIVIGFLLLISLTVETLVRFTGDFMLEWLGSAGLAVLDFFRPIFFFFLVWFVFTGIYKILPDANVKWKQLFPGSLLATILFFIGKYSIEQYFVYTSWGTAYGAAGALVLILLWVYYSSIILLIGAEYVEVSNRMNGDLIKPSKDARKIIAKEVHL